MKNSVKSQTRLRPSRRAELVADYAAGMPVQVISAKYGVHRATIPKFVQREGISVRTSVLSAEEQARAASLYESGMTLMEVGSRFGVSQQSARRAVAAEGVKIRPRGRRGPVIADWSLHGVRAYGRVAPSGADPRSGSALPCRRSPTEDPHGPGEVA